jgi:iron complex transport system substrate-binding protein
MGYLLRTSLLVVLTLLSMTGSSLTIATATAQTPPGTPAPSSPQLPATVRDAAGNSVEVTDVSRIIPLNGNVAETIFALGLGANVVAVDVSARYPEEATRLPKIGYQRELSAEGILSFEPTVVIGTENAGPPDVIEQIRAAGVTVVILPIQDAAAGAVDLIRAVGAALGVSQPAELLAGSAEARIAEAQELTRDVEEQDRPRVVFLYIRGQGTQLMAGTNTQADAVIAAAGGINVGAELGIDGYQPITPEALVEAAPEILLVMQDGLASVGGVDGLLSIPGIRQTPAGESGAIIAFEDLYLLGFGPRIGDAIYDLTLALYPEIDATPLHPEWQGTDVLAEATPAASPVASPAS